MTIRPSLARARALRRTERGGQVGPAARRRREAMSLSSVNALAGLWLIFSPWVLGFSDGPIWNNLVFGGLITLFALGRASRARKPWPSWVNLLVGAWVFGTGFWLYETSAGGWNSVIAGGVVMLFATWSAAASEGQAGRPTPPE